MQNEPKYVLADFTTEEGTVVKTAIDAVLAEYSAQLAVSPTINKDGTLGAKVEIYKKVELVAKDSVVSPIQPDADGTIKDEGTEPEAETAS